ncbi:MAG: PKD domain-containing protein [Euryarchaeota archaeon]|nr:PKD domain-containing protein [Euryarchaeota archaeon]
MKRFHLNLRKGSIVVLALILITTSVSVVAETSSIFYVDLTQSLPGDWTIINGGNTIDTWTYLEGGFGVFCDDRSAGSAAVMDEQLISPIVDCSRLTSVSLEYFHNFNGGSKTNTDQGDVYVSNDGGASWNNVATYLPGTSRQGTDTIDITSLAAGQSKVMINFHFRDFGKYGYWWQVFNVRISGEIKEITDPVADFSLSPEQQNEGLPIQFTDISTLYPGNVISWSWDFGGLGASFEQNPTFTFMDNGVYSVTLTITDDGSTNAVSHVVTVLDLAPIAAFTWSPEQQYKKSPIQFTDLSTSSPDNIISWSWDFDGLGTSSEQDPTFTFMNDGTHTVSLTVADEDGSIATISHDVTILKFDSIAAIENLIQDVRNMNLNKGIQTSLVVKLKGAIWCIDNGYYNAAIVVLKTFINEVKALNVKKITKNQADILKSSAQYIIDNM